MKEIMYKKKMMKAFGWCKAVEYLVRIDRNNENHICCIYVGIGAYCTNISQDMKMEAIK